MACRGARRLQRRVVVDQRPAGPRRQPARRRPRGARRKVTVHVTAERADTAAVGVTWSAVAQHQPGRDRRASAGSSASSATDRPAVTVFTRRAVDGRSTRRPPAPWPRCSRPRSRARTRPLAKTLAGSDGTIARAGRPAGRAKQLHDDYQLNPELPGRCAAEPDRQVPDDAKVGNESSSSPASCCWPAASASTPASPPATSSTASSTKFDDHHSRGRPPGRRFASAQWLGHGRCRS